MRPYRRLCLDPKAHLRPILLHLRPARHKETHETRDTRHETRKVVELGCLSTAAARIVRLAGSRAAAPRLMRSQALLERPHADHRVPAARGRWVWPPSQRLRERAACWCPFFSRMCVDGLVQRAGRIIFQVPDARGRVADYLRRRRFRKYPQESRRPGRLTSDTIKP